MRRKMVTALGALALLAASTAVGEAKSPIFGDASVSVLSADQNKSVLGKGYYADYYASYGIDYANIAAAYGNYGDYASAESAAYNAYSFFSVAAYYQAAGY